MNELPALTDDCRYLVLLAKVQNKVDKNEEALLSLQKVSVSSISGSLGLLNYYPFTFWIKILCE